MNRRAVDTLLDGLAPSHDEGWAWLRKMHELGMDLEMDDPSDFPVFVGRGSLQCSLFVAMRAGSAMWLPLFAGEYLGAADTRTGNRPVFPDPITAAVWAETEAANTPPKPRKQKASGQPKAHPTAAWPAPCSIPMPQQAPAQPSIPPPHPWEPGSP